MIKRIIQGDQIAYHPAVHLKNLMEDEEVGVADFAQKLSMEVSQLQTFLRFESRVDLNLAIALETATGVALTTWLRRQDDYDKMISLITTI